MCPVPKNPGPDWSPTCPTPSNRRLFLFSPPTVKMSAGTQGGPSGVRGEEMEEEMEMEEDSSSTVTILVTHGTFIPGRYGY
jgi:hypothetical protein